MNRRFWLLRGLRFVVFAALFVAAVGFVTMSLWNWLVPPLFNGPFLSFWQALGLLLLSRLLFGGFRGRPGGHWARKRREFWRQKMEARLSAMTPEEQEKFRQKMRRCGPAWMRREPAVEEPQAVRAQ